MIPPKFGGGAMNILASGWSVRASFFAALLASLAFAFAFAPAAGAAMKYPKKRPVLCPLLHEPVCTRTSLGVLTSYANACLAHADGAAVIARGPCSSLDCPPAELPVCARKGGVNQVFLNRCAADKAGAMVIAAGICPEVCSQELRWVCAVDEAGRRGDYRNACQAMIAGARVLHPGKCLARPACAPDGLRVCALDVRTGKEQVYANHCLAEVANATWLRNGRCTPGRLRKLFTRGGATP
jgi:hypothetical protein